MNNDCSIVEVTINLVAWRRNIHVILCEFQDVAGMERSIYSSFKYLTIFSIHLTFKLKAPPQVSVQVVSSIRQVSIN